MNPPEINNLNPEDNIPKFETTSSSPIQTNINSNFPNGYQNVPNSVGVLVLGILSICFCWCYGIVSIITAIVALVLASTAEKEYQANPGKYSLASYKNVKAGKICAIIGLCLVGLGILLLIAYVLLVGSIASSFLNF
ncbi:MAG: CCC motif membrane protein [Bacteroidota bacterium]|nr:CCC motif membrane protein [Bacteroidota bacterium]